MNERQIVIFRLISDAITPVSIETLMGITQKSKRTIFRDLATINQYLSKKELGTIESTNEGYRITLVDNNQSQKIFNHQINDEETILLALVQNDYVTIEQLTEKLYASRFAITEKMNIVKMNYKDVFNISVTNKGHHLNEPIYKKLLIVANIIQRNIDKYLHDLDISTDQYQKTIFFIKESPYFSVSFPNCSPAQIFYLIFATYLITDEINSFCKWISLEDFLSIIADVKSSKYLEEFSNHCMMIKESLSKEKIYNTIELLKEEFSIEFEDEEELIDRLEDHLLRELSYTYYLKDDSLYNISDYMALYPFSFDLSMYFCNYLATMYNFEIYNSKLIGLYFAVYVEKNLKENKKILLYAPQSAISFLNRELLQDYFTGVTIELGDNVEKLSNHYSLIIDCTQALNSTEYPVVKVKNQLFTKSDLQHFQNILENIYIHNHKKDIFNQPTNFTYPILNQKNWISVIEGITLMLQSKNVISSDERKAILTREQQDNSLIINDIIIPHCISKHSGRFNCYYVHLDNDFIYEDRKIRHVLITVVSPENQKKSNLFKFLYNYFVDNKDYLSQVNNLEDFIDRI